MRIHILDTETSLRNLGAGSVGDFGADPFHPDNWAVWVGLLEMDDKLKVVETTRLKKFPDGKCTIRAPGAGSLLVGHNIGFDILHLCNKTNTEWRAWVEFLQHPASLIWDTMAAEFRLLGHSVTMPSLDDCCERRGWPVKPGRLKEYWKEGISTENIPDEEVKPYLTHDVESTARLFADQVRGAKSRGMLPLLRLENDAILATTLARYNGMKFNARAASEKLERDLRPRVDALTKEVTTALSVATGVPETHINPNSNQFLTKVLYGGQHDYVVKEESRYPTGEVVRYKTGARKGEVKLQNVTHTVFLKPKVTGDFEGVGEDTLDMIKAQGAYAPDVDALFDKVLQLRKLSKTIGTYYEGYTALTWPQDSCIHGSLNHCVAVTSRLSSTDPNLQNVGRKGLSKAIREHFESRYTDGYLLEMDLSQIEVVVQAFLTQDPQLMADVIAGVDFHCKRAAAAAKDTYEAAVAGHKAKDPTWEKRRDDAKEFSFKRAYGAGAASIAAMSGLSVAEVESYIAAEEEMYPGVVASQQAWIAEVNRTCTQRDGEVCGVLLSPTGAQYRFKRTPDFKGRMNIKPTIVKNYPIQGLAADIIKCILHLVRKELFHLNADQPSPVLLTMTVHDSVIFDVPGHVQRERLEAALLPLFTTGAVEELRRRFKMNFNVPIRADAKAGSNWLVMK